MKELLKRVIVAIIGIPIFIFSIFFGNEALFVLVLIISTISLWEYYKLFEKKEVYPHIITGLVFNIIIISSFFAGLKNGKNNFEIIFIEIVFFSLLIIAKEMWSKNNYPLKNSSSTISGILYITLPFVMFIGLRFMFEQNYCSYNNHLSMNMFISDFGFNSNNSGAWIVMISLISIWICDSFAYFFGKAFGKHRLYEKISPKKSWEGSIAGFIGSILTYTLLTHFLIKGFPLIHGIILGALIGSIGQLGDLAESQLKRDAGVKDSSNILPGHGGFLDRFDSIIYVIPVVYIYFSIIKMFY